MCTGAWSASNGRRDVESDGLTHVEDFGVSSAVSPPKKRTGDAAGLVAEARAL